MLCHARESFMYSRFISLDSKRDLFVDILYSSLNMLTANVKSHSGWRVPTISMWLMVSAHTNAMVLIIHTMWDTEDVSVYGHNHGNTYKYMHTCIESSCFLYDMNDIFFAKYTGSEFIISLINFQNNHTKKDILITKIFLDIDTLLLLECLEIIKKYVIILGLIYDTHFTIIHKHTLLTSRWW